MDCNCQRSFWNDSARFAEALYKWVKAGSPYRTPEEILCRWRICRQCERFEKIPGKPWRGRCGVCGCYLGRHGRRFLELNKIAFATETCPEGKWS